MYAKYLLFTWCLPGKPQVFPWLKPGVSMEDRPQPRKLENCIPPGESLENRSSPGFPLGKTWNSGPGEMREDRLSPGEKLEFQPGRSTLGKAWETADGVKPFAPLERSPLY